MFKTIKEFRGSAVKMTPTAFSNTYGIEVSEEVSVIVVYADGLFLEQAPDRTYFTIINRSDYTGTKKQLSEKLWEFYQGENENVDLFESYENLPQEVQDVILIFGDSNGYEECEALLRTLKPLGYTFDYGLDGQPFNLKNI